MADLLAESRAYLEARLKQCETSPVLNKHQIVEYKRFIAMVDGCKTPEEYSDQVAADGDMFSISKAEQLDRWTNMKSLYERNGDAALAQAVGFRLAAASASTSHMDLYEKMQAANDEAAPVEQNARAGVQAFVDLVGALAAYATTAPSRKPAAKAAAHAAFAAWKARDPEAGFDKARRYPPYQSVVPFADERLDAFAGWLAEVMK